MYAKTQRAWNNKLNGINDLLYWMYENDVLNKGEKAKKDTVFRQYYRYYNDGDTPRGVLTKYKISAYDRNMVSRRLEEYLEEFVRKILTKYCGKYDKTAFRIWRKNKALEAVAWRVEAGYDADERLDAIKDEEIKDAVLELEIRRAFLLSILVEQNPELSRYTAGYIAEQGENVTEIDLDEWAVIESRQKRLAKAIRNLKVGE